MSRYVILHGGCRYSTGRRESPNMNLSCLHGMNTTGPLPRLPSFGEAGGVPAYTSLALASGVEQVRDGVRLRAWER